VRNPKWNIAVQSVSQADCHMYTTVHGWLIYTSHTGTCYREVMIRFILNSPTYKTAALIDC